MKKEKFIELYNRYNGEEIDKLSQLVSDTYSGKELYDFCKFILENSKETEKQEEVVLESGMWVHIPNTKFLIYLKEVDEFTSIAYGFDKSGDWNEEVPFGLVGCVPAPFELVKERLTKYAESIGLEKGAEVKCFLDELVHELRDVSHTPAADKSIEHGFFVMRDEHGMNTTVLNSQGEWAKPLTEIQSAVNRLQEAIDKAEGKIKIKIDIEE